jgi:hypothetical protein
LCCDRRRGAEWNIKCGKGKRGRKEDRGFARVDSKCRSEREGERRGRERGRGLEWWRKWNESDQIKIIDVTFCFEQEGEEVEKRTRKVVLAICEKLLQHNLKMAIVDVGWSGVKIEMKIATLLYGDLIRSHKI